MDINLINKSFSDISRENKQNEINIFNELIFIAKELFPDKNFEEKLEFRGFIRDYKWNIKYLLKSIDNSVIIEYFNDSRAINHCYAILDNNERALANSGESIKECINNYKKLFN